MAKRTRKSARPRAARKPTVEKEPLLSKAAKQDIAAIFIVGVAVLIIVAFFGGAGSLGINLLALLKTLIGQAVYPLPFALFFLAYALFRVSKYELKANNYFGLIVFFILLAGIVQFGIAGDGSALSELSNQGGFIGYGLWMLINPLLTRPLALFVLVLLELVTVIIATNVRLIELWRKVRGKKPDGEPELEVKQAGFTVNTKLPFKGAIGGGEEDVKAKPTARAVTAMLDKNWKYPPLDLLKGMSTKADAGNEKEKAGVIGTTFKEFAIDVKMVGVNVGPTVAQYTMRPSTGVKLNKITTLDRNLALALKAPQVRIEAPIPGTDLVGIEVPNEKAAQVRLRDIMESKEMQAKPSKLEFVLGRDVAGDVLTADLASMPHLLVAGTTGSGKSVMINTLLTSFLYRNSPAELRLILVDPKRVEMTLYNDIPHLLTPVIYEPDKTISALKWAVGEMDRRLKLLADKTKRNIAEYNALKEVEPMPYIVIVLDEFSDLMAVAGKDVEALIVRIAQMARAVGIHLVLATQRPSVGVVTGIIKANVPARIALTTASQIDSRTIIDQAGAEKLLGKGDMLFSSPEFMKPKRAQGVLLTNEEVSAVTKFLRDEQAPEYLDDVLAQAVKIGHRGVMAAGGGGRHDDDLYDEVLEFVLRSGEASSSRIQRQFRVGYARAASLIDMLEDNGVIGPKDGAKPRKVLISSADLAGSEGGGMESHAAEEGGTDE